MATITRGRALNDRGRREEAIEQIRQGLAALQATGTELFRPHFLALLGEALRDAGQAEEGLRVSEEALEMAHRTCEGNYLAELYRLKGELLLLQPKGRDVSRAATDRRAPLEAELASIARAEACFNQSIEIARHQKAKSWELRAAMSLARLHQNQGKKKAARCLLAEIYGTFTEGLDTMDLREAKALLDDLVSPSCHPSESKRAVFANKPQ
jgi:predicted ATPase